MPETKTSNTHFCFQVAFRPKEEGRTASFQRTDEHRSTRTPFWQMQRNLLYKVNYSSTILKVTYFLMLPTSDLIQVLLIEVQVFHVKYYPWVVPIHIVPIKLFEDWYIYDFLVNFSLSRNLKFDVVDRLSTVWYITYRYFSLKYIRKPTLEDLPS